MPFVTTLHPPLSPRSSVINETAAGFKKDLDTVSLFFSENPGRWFEWKMFLIGYRIWIVGLQVVWGRLWSLSEGQLCWKYIIGGELWGLRTSCHFLSCSSVSCAWIKCNQPVSCCCQQDRPSLPLWTGDSGNIRQSNPFILKDAFGPDVYHSGGKAHTSSRCLSDFLSALCSPCSVNPGL